VQLNGTTALVTGGARRVGRAIVQALAHAGCDVAVHYLRSETEARQLVSEVTAAGVRAVAVRGDLHDPASWPAIVEETVETLGRLNILVNNAAVFLTQEADTLDDFSPRLWEGVLRTNLTAVCGLCHHARRHLEADGRGRIVNLCDISAERPWPDHLAYCVSKAGLAALTRALARELAPAILVNGVAPGIAAFPEEYADDTRRKLTRRVPLGRPGTPNDVAQAVRFLVESNDYITGEIIRVDGGRSLE